MHSQQTTTMPSNTQKTLRFITCGSVDDGKSTLIGRLLLDSKTVLQDQLESVRKKSTHAGSSDELDLAMFTDGLIAEREQGITIDVAYRYFATPKRKFIIGDAPGHEQYTRNMVTAASSADAAIVLIDATKLPLTHTDDQANTTEATYDASILLTQTRRHALLAQLLRVTHIVFAVNKLDAVPNPELVFKRIRLALADFAQKTKIQPSAIVPISALLGSNVVFPEANFAGYHGPSLLSILENLPAAVEDEVAQFGFPVQWVEKSASSSDTSAARRILWGRIASGQIQVGQMVSLHPSGIQSKVARIYDHCRQNLPAKHTAQAGSSVGIVLETELDVSRGDYLLGIAEQHSAQTPLTPQKSVQATIAWLGNEALSTGQIYYALHGFRWVKAKVSRITHSLNIKTLETETAETLGPNAIGAIELQLQEALPLIAYQNSKRRGALILADTANNTVAALLVQ